jgi:MFS family permease
VSTVAAAGRADARLGRALMLIALVVAVVGSLGAPLITSVATSFNVSLAAAQWTLTAPLLAGAIAPPVFGRLGAGAHRRPVMLVALGIVLAGSILTALPLGYSTWAFALLVAGRTAQGIGLGLTALTMGVARDHIADSAPAIALLSVASTVGIGVGYPFAGLITQLAGLRVTYTAGLLVAAIAFAVAWRFVPDAPAGRGVHIDIPGTVVLSTALVAVFLVLSGTLTGIARLAVLVLSVVLLAIWVAVERRAAAPLVDLALLRHPSVAAANIVMLLGGVSMYLLLTLVTRYLQTPTAAGYGFGATVLTASLVLIPFSAFGFVGGRLPWPPQRRLVIGGLATTAGLAFFAVARDQLWRPYATMGLLGLGVGAFSSAMPAIILAVTPAAETSSSMSFNQVVRGTAFSAGSALCGLLLAAYTPSRQAFPTDHGYTIAALIGTGAMLATLIVVGLSRARASRV